MKTEAPIVDVVLPVYNAGSTIEEAVESIRAQALRGIRIIIIDDGSTDETPELLSKLAREDPRIVLLRKPNGGIVDALNFGLDHCRAEFVARQDADDVSDPDRLAAQVKYLEMHPDCV